MNFKFNFKILLSIFLNFHSHGLSVAGRIREVRGRIQKTTKLNRTDLERILDQLCTKGLVIDLDVNGTRHFMASPMVIGIFEFTMMRTGENLDSKGWAKHFHDYMSEGGMYKSNFAKGQQISLMRTVPHDESVRPSSYAEILDYEKAISLDVRVLNNGEITQTISVVLTDKAGSDD